MDLSAARSRLAKEAERRAQVLAKLERLPPSPGSRKGSKVGSAPVRCE
jgi:hypothetical protein